MAERKHSLIIEKDIPSKIGLISDIHGNYYALIRALNIFNKHNINKYIFLGDSIGYIPSLKALNIIFQKSEDFLCIKGNHGHMLLNKNICSKRNKIYLLDAVGLRIGTDKRKYINSWQDSLIIKFEEKSFLFVHGSPSDPINGYVYPDTELDQFDTKHDVIFMGHSHWAFDRSYKTKRFINPGSCGLPRDNGQFGSIGIFNFNTLKYKPIRFDISDSYMKLKKEYPEIDKSVLDLRHRKKIKIPREEIA